MYSLLSFKRSKFFEPFKSNSPLVVVLTILTTLLFTDICLAKLKIESLSIPQYVENGTEDSVVLDCVYSLDREDDKNLVVKWYLNDDPEPIYQFLAEFGTRYPSGRLKDRINVDYAVDNDPFTKYRALNLLRPTVDLSGRYSCQVTSVNSHDSKEGSMTVYATPKQIEFGYKAVPREVSAARRQKTKDTLNDLAYSNDEQFSSSSELQCTVKNVYPLPEIIIYRVGDGNRIETLGNLHKVFNQTSNGAFKASVSVFIDDKELIRKYGNEASIFECLVFFNELGGKEHEARERIQYYPVNEEIGNLSAESSKLSYTSLLTIVFSFIYLCFKLNMNELNFN